MFSILLVDGTVCKEHQRILKEQKKFYEELYTTDPMVNFTIKNTTTVKLTEVQKASIDQDISLDECILAIKELKSNKVPGSDGLGVEFYRKMWDIIETPFLGDATRSFVHEQT